MFGGTGTNTGPDGADVFVAGTQGVNGDEVNYAGSNDAINATIGGAANDGAGGCPAGAGLRGRRHRVDCRQHHRR